MRALTASLAFLSALISLPLLFASFFLIRSSLVMPESAAWWQSGAVLLVLWILGWYGFAGLLQMGSSAHQMTRARLQIHQLLLVSGVLSALIIIGALWCFGLVAAMGNVRFVLLIFPGIAVVLALIRLSATAAILRKKPACNPSLARRWLMALALLPALMVVGVIGLRETVVWWYGHDLGNRMHQSAKQLAQEQAYCVLTDAGELSQHGINARAAVLRALSQRFDVGPNTQFIKRPHAQLLTAENYYLWSFSQADFLVIPHSTYSAEALRRCAAVSSSESSARE